MNRISKGYRPLIVALALQFTVLLYPGCNRQTSKREPPSTPLPSTDNRENIQPYGELALARSFDVPTGSVARGFAVAPQGGSVAVGGGDGSIVLVDLQGRVIRTFDGHREEVLELVFTPDGQNLVSGGADNQLIVWDVETGQVLQRKKAAHNGDIKALAVSPDGALIASGSVDDTVRIWRRTTLERIHLFEGHTMSVYATVFSPDGRHVFSGARDAEVRKWSLQTGRQVGEPLRFRNSIIGLGFAPDNRTLVAGSLSNEVMVIDADGLFMKSKRSLPGKSRLTDIGLSNDGQIVAVQKAGTLSMWPLTSTKNTDETRSIRLEGATFEMVAFIPHTTRVITLAGDGTMRIVDAGTANVVGPPVSLPPVNGTVRSSALGLAEKSVAVASDGRLFVGQVESKLSEVALPGPPVSALAFIPDSKDLLVGRADGALLRVSLETREVVSSASPHTGAVRHLEYSPFDGSLWSAGDDIKIIQHDVTSGTARRTLTDHTSPIRSLAVDPSGKRVASTETNNITIVRDIERGQTLWTRRGHAIEQLSFSPDGRILAMVEDRVFIVLYKVDEREELKRLKGSPTRITGLRYHPKGEVVVTTDVLGGVRVWSVSNGSMLSSANAGRGRPRTLEIGRSGETILTGGMDPRGSLRLFRLGPKVQRTTE